MMKKVILALSCIAVIAFGVVFFMQDTSPKEQNKPSKQEQNKDTSPVQKKYFAVYRVDKDANNLIKEIYEQPQTADVDVLKLAVDTLVKKQPQKEGLNNIFPERVKILGVKQVGSLVQVDFSKELLQNGGGSTYELFLVGSLVNTLTEIPGVDSVQILVEGKKVETISGHLDATEPFRRNESLIKK